MATPKMLLKKFILVNFDSRQSQNGNNSLGEVAGVGLLQIGRLRQAHLIVGCLKWGSSGRVIRQLTS